MITTRFRMVWISLLLLLAAAGISPAMAQEMNLSEELETCSSLDRPVLEQMFAGGADEFLGKITVLYNVAPPKPELTPRVFADRDPIYYNKVDYREQIKYYDNLNRMFQNQKEYRNEVRFLLSASLHRVPYELAEYNFTNFIETVRAVAGEYNLTVYANQLTENRTFALFGLREFQVYVIDRCSRISYIIQPPWSLIQYAYVKAAVLSTFYDRPCGKCELENFLNSTLAEDEKQSPGATFANSNGSTESSGVDASNDTKPYEDASEEFSTTGEDDEEAEGERMYSEEDENDNESSGDQNGGLKDEVDPFENLTITEPELEIPLRIILPVMHIHVPDGNESSSTRHQLHQYIVLYSNDSDVHDDQPGPPQPEVELQELPLTMAQNDTINSTKSHNDVIRIDGTDWYISQLWLILNTTSVLYDPKQQRIFERLQRYNLTDRTQYDQVAEVSVSNRFEAWYRRRTPPKTESSRNNKRYQIKKHYARLIPWLNWTFGNAIPPLKRTPVSGSAN